MTPTGTDSNVDRESERERRRAGGNGPNRVAARLVMKSARRGGRKTRTTSRETVAAGWFGKDTKDTQLGRKSLTSLLFLAAYPPCHLCSPPPCLLAPPPKLEVCSACAPFRPSRRKRGGWKEKHTRKKEKLQYSTAFETEADVVCFLCSHMHTNGI